MVQGPATKIVVHPFTAGGKYYAPTIAWVALRYPETLTTAMQDDVLSFEAAGEAMEENMRIAAHGEGLFYELARLPVHSFVRQVVNRPDT